MVSPTTEFCRSFKEFFASLFPHIHMSCDTTDWKNMLFLFTLKYGSLLSLWSQLTFSSDIQQRKTKKEICIYILFFKSICNKFQITLLHIFLFCCWSYKTEDYRERKRNKSDWKTLLCRCTVISLWMDTHWSEGRLHEFQIFFSLLLFGCSSIMCCFQYTAASAKVKVPFFIS